MLSLSKAQECPFAQKYWQSIYFFFLPILSFSPCMLKTIVSLPTAQALQHCKFSLSHTLRRQNENEEQGQY